MDEEPVALATGRKESPNDASGQEPGQDIETRAQAPEDNGTQTDAAVGEPGRNVITEEMARSTQQLNRGLVNAADTDRTADNPPLTPSEREEAIKAHADIIERLPARERNKLTEYYRILRDVR